MMFVFVWLTSLSVITSRSIQVAANGIISFFLWLRNILDNYHLVNKNPLYVYYLPGATLGFIETGLLRHLRCGITLI